MGEPVQELAGSRARVGGHRSAVRAGLGLALVALSVSEMQRRAIRRSSEAGVQVRQALGTAEPILPHTTAERPEFLALSVTAGIREEILYRGFLIWYLASWLPLWAAATGSAAVFGWAHAYLGPRAAWSKPDS